MGPSAETVARELSPDEHADRHEVCHELAGQVQKAIALGRVALWQLARALHEFDEAAAWGPLGYDSLNHWLADPDVGIAKSTFYRLVREFRTLVVVRKVDEDRLQELDPSKVDLVIPAIEAGRVSLDEALGDVKSMGWRDLRETYGGETSSSPGPQSGDGQDGGAERNHDTDSQDGDSAPPDLGTEDALECWRALLDELVEVESSGQDEPRISAALIAPGIGGLRVALRELANTAIEGTVEDDALAVERLLLAIGGDDAGQ